MFVIHGFYHWRPRRTAFRNDYCRTCEAERLSVLLRTFDVLHIYWIPVLPVGVWSRWHCTTCGFRPHAAIRSRRGFKVAGAVALGALALLAWADPEVKPSEAIWVWGIRLGLALAAMAAGVWTFRHPREPRFREVLAGVKPFAGWTCPLCAGPLQSVPDWHCTACGARHRPLTERYPPS